MTCCTSLCFCKRRLSCYLIHCPLPRCFHLPCVFCAWRGLGSPPWLALLPPPSQPCHVSQLCLRARAPGCLFHWGLSLLNQWKHFSSPQLSLSQVRFNYFNHSSTPSSPLSHCCLTFGFNCFQFVNVSVLFCAEGAFRYLRAGEAFHGLQNGRLG